MTDRDDENEEDAFSDLAKHTIVAHAIAPNADEIATQRFAKSAGIARTRDSRIKIAKDLLLDLSVELQKLFAR